MKKKYIAPETNIICLHNSGNILLGSLEGGEVGAPVLMSEESDNSSIFDPIFMNEP